MTYSLIDMYIILPLAIFFMIKWITLKKDVYLVLAGVAIAIFSSLHLVSIYVPYVGAVALVSLLVYKLWTRKTVARYVTLTAIVILVNVVCLIAFMRSQTMTLNELVFGHAASMVSTPGDVTKNMGVFIGIYFVNMPTFIGLVTLYYAITCRKMLDISYRVKCLLAIIGVISASLLVGGIMGFGGYPDRLMLDGILFMALLVAVLLGQLLKLKDANLYWLKTLSSVGIGACILIRVIEWMR